MFNFLWVLIAEGIIDAIAGAVSGRDVPGSIIGNIIMGFLGSWAASLLLPSLRPVIGGFLIISTLLGAIIYIAIYSFIVNRKA